jgi:DNA-binding winged helix-turn-helix (wHTH) protein
VARDPIQLGNFALDCEGQCLIYRGRQVALRQKAFLVLRHLAERPGILLSADDLHARAWPGLAVTPQTLTNVISELRKLTRLDPEGSLRIETRYGRGYRLLVEHATASATVTEHDDPRAAEPAERASASPILVGRDDDLACLTELAQRALAGRRQIVFVAGAAGIGKSTLIDAFLAGQAAASFVRGHGRCVVRQAETEAYAPLLDALEEISREIDLVEDLRRCAPSWLAQMPWLLPASETTALRQSLLGSGALRPLREGVKLIEELAAQRPLLLVLEDLHGTDAATVDLLAALIERSTPARLLVLASYRPPDAFLRGALAGLPPQRMRAPCVTRLLLEPLSSSAVRRYLEQRLDDTGIGAAITGACEEKSGGNPLFLREIVDTLLDRGALVRDAGCWQLGATPAELQAMLPDGVRDLIAEHVAKLPARQIETLEAASAAGARFTVSLVAAALARPDDEVARDCRTLAAHSHFLADDGERAMPDGSVVEAFRFTHALYQQALGERLSATLRRPLHARIAAQLEREYGVRVTEVATRLALHFETGEVWDKALLYLQLAGYGAAERAAYHDAAELARRAIAVSRRLPSSRDIAHNRVELLLASGNLAMMLGGFHDPGAHRAYDDALAELTPDDDVVLRFRVQAGRCLSALFRGAPDAAVLAEELLAIADAAHPELACLAHLDSSYVAHGRGDLAAFAAHVAAAQRALPHAAPGIPQGSCLEAHVASDAARAALLAGDHAGWQHETEHAVRVLRERANPLDRASTLALLASIALVARDAATTLALTDEALAVAEQFGLASLPFSGLAAACRAWAACALGRDTLDSFAAVIDERARRAERWMQPLLRITLAEMRMRAGDVQGARTELERATTDAGELPWAAEAERVAGELLLAADTADAAGARFTAALQIAREQGVALFAERAQAALALIQRAPS